GHGTFVSGVILGEAPSATIVMYNALDDVSADGGDSVRSNDQLVADALDALSKRENLIAVNLSFFGIDEDPDHPSEIIGAAIARMRATNSDVFIVAAAGNDWTDTVTYPAAFEGVVGVGAVDETVYPGPDRLDSPEETTN